MLLLAHLKSVKNTTKRLISSVMELIFGFGMLTLIGAGFLSYCLLKSGDDLDD